MNKEITLKDITESDCKLAIQMAPYQCVNTAENSRTLILRGTISDDFRDKLMNLDTSSPFFLQNMNKLVEQFQ